MGGDVATVLINDPIAETQPETGSFAHGFRREKWIENLREIFVVNPRSIVLKGDSDTIAGGFRTDTNFASGPVFFDGLAGVIQEVQEYLLKLMRITEHFREARL